MVIVKSLVSELALDPNVLTLCVGDNLREILNADASPVTVTVTPANASDPSWSWAVKAGEEDFAPNLSIEKVGVFHVVYTANGGNGVMAELTIKAVGDFVYPTEVTAAIGTPQAFAITLPDALKEENFAFDPTKISFMVNGGLRNGDHPFTTELADETGLNWNITGKYVGEYEFVVAYDGKPIPTKDDTGAPVASVVKIPARVALADGWNWSSAFAVVGESYALLTNEGVQEQIKDADDAKKINEIRSQTKFIFNDPVYGFFGDLSELKPDSMYKIKSNGARILDFGSSADMVRNYTWNLNTGYNWVNYPYEFDVTVADLQDMLPLPAEAEGDFILAKGAQMQCDYNSETAQGQWIPDDNFKFESGKGYIYYRAGEPTSCTFNVNLKAPKPAAPNGIRGKNTVRVWEVQSSRFADNMPIVATVEGLRNPENYIVGAFVGDECRGTGSLAVRDLMFISVAGVAGEKITFRLYNKFTGEFSTINEEVTYSGKAGSMKAPLRLSSPAATGVSSLKANEAASDAVYNLAGQKLSAPRKGIHIVGGRKVVF